MSMLSISDNLELLQGENLAGGIQYLQQKSGTPMRGYYPLFARPGIKSIGWGLGLRGNPSDAS